MNVRLIAGKFGGRIIDAPGRQSTHAMSERVRGALFNIIASELDGAAVLDAYAGSGSLGIEALSRGAASAVFIEKDRIAAKIIRKNCAMLDIQASVVQTTVGNWLSTSAENTVFDIIFADPPYNDIQVNTLQNLQSRLKAGGLLIVSHPVATTIGINDGMTLESQRTYGNANLSFIRRLS